MQLPRGIFHRPRQERLIALNEPATIRIETAARYPGNAGYRVNDRSFEKAIAPYLLGDWEDFDRRYRLSRQRKISVGGAHQESDVIYSGAEHRGDPKLPNITVLPNLTTEQSAWRAFGCTMGHYHPSQEAREARVQEVYEFQSHGLLALVREEGGVELWVARDGDKIAVPNGVHMTLYNLDDEDYPLITLDFADPDRNPANKDLIGQCGPVLLACYNDLEAVFTLNRLYLDNPNHSVGVRLPNPPLEESDRQIKIARGARLSLGQLLYERLARDPDVIGQFARLGLRIRRASPEAALTPLSADRSSRLYFTMPLAEGRPIEWNRERALQHGLTLDLLSHFPPLLAYFGDVGTIDEIRVLAAGQYRPLIMATRDGAKTGDISDRFRNETYSRVAFTFRDYSGNDHRVPCLAVTGKGLSQEVKYMQVTGRNGQAVRLDLNREPGSGEASDYPWDSLFFLHNPRESLPSGAVVREVADPYCPRRRLRVLDDPNDASRFRRRVVRERYEKLLDDLLGGTNAAVASTLLLTEAPEIVEALDRIWRAVQDERPAWKDYDLGGLDPVRPDDH